MNQTTQKSVAFSPVQSGERINSLDVIRGIALLGILLMNINGMGLPFSYMDPTIVGNAESLNVKVWAINSMLFEGTMRGLFTLLFGAGVILLTTRLDKKGAGIAGADIYYRRILWMLLFGIGNVYLLLWQGDILFPYAIFGLMLFPFRNSSVRQLFLVAGILISLGILWDISDYHTKHTLQKESIEIQLKKDQGSPLTEQEEASLKDWDKFNTKHTQKEIDEKIEQMQQGYFGVFKAKIKENQFMQTWFPYRLWPWDILPFMLIGMAFFKLRIFHGERSNQFYLLFILLGYGIGLSVNFYETSIWMESDFAQIIHLKADQTYHVGRLFTTMGHVGLFMLFIKSGILAFLQKRLAAVGKMALTNYLMHSVITSIIFYGDGFALFGMLERYELYYIVGGIWIFQLIVSPIWLKYFLFGPAEWIWRSLTYKQVQPLRIKQ
jgi:uncharacterized protein